MSRERRLFVRVTESEALKVKADASPLTISDHARVLLGLDKRPTADHSHPIYLWAKLQDWDLAQLAAHYSISPQAVSHYISGRRAISRALADRLARESRDRVPWTCWPLVRGVGGRYYHCGTLVPVEQLAALRQRLNPPSPLASLARES